MAGKISSIVQKNLEDIIKNLGYQLYEVEFKKKQNGMNLTLFIYADRPITLNDCEKVHKTVDLILDELDPTNGEPYHLNVSSVGLDKPLKSDKDFNRVINFPIVIKLFMTKNQKEIEGILKGFDKESILIETKEKKEKISRKDIALCKPLIKF